MRIFGDEEMNYVKLKDVCTINMGQSPSSDSYNENGHGVPFFQGNADFGERYPVTGGYTYFSQSAYWGNELRQRRMLHRERLSCIDP